MKRRQVNIILGKHAKAPTYATDYAAGADLYSANADPIVIAPNQRILVPTGIRLELPSDAEGCIRPRSGLSLKRGLVAILGTIDADYQGEVGIILHNVSETTWTIQAGERLAQIVFNGDGGLFQAEWSEVSAFERDSERGSGGFGHTGIR